MTPAALRNLTDSELRQLVLDGEEELRRRRAQLNPITEVDIEMLRNTGYTKHERCAYCAGTGRLAGGVYCGECVLGRDLERVEVRTR